MILSDIIDIIWYYDTICRTRAPG